jgi:hypothetical protein
LKKCGEALTPFLPLPIFLSANIISFSSSLSVMVLESTSVEENETIEVLRFSSSGHSVIPVIFQVQF